ncbi:carboxylate--amine ligase [Georgenia sp. Marseille-Q6866]
MADFRPVLLGTDLGVYSIARSFHEAYGVRSIVVSNQSRGPVDHSRILDNVLVGAGASEEQTVAALVDVARQHAGTPLLLLVNAEHEVEMLVRHRAVLEEHYVIPYASNEVLTAAGDKEVLAAACERLGVATPATRAVDLAAADDGGWAPPRLDLTFPVVLKPAVSAEHLLLSYEGKRKVYSAATQAEADAVLRRLAAAGLRDVVLVQELIPGDDTQGRTVTCYVDRSGEVTLMASGQLLLQLHAPTMIGNSATILTEAQPEIEAQAAAVLGELGFTGFANFDVKVDPRDGRAHFLDLNPRIGRPNYFLNVAGRNPARAVVADFAAELGAAPASGPLYRPEQEVGVYSYLPWRLVRRYLTDPELRRRVGRIHRTRRFTHPLAYPLDRDPRRGFYRAASTANLVRDFTEHYPEPTPTGL